MESILIPEGETLTLDAEDRLTVNQVTAPGLIDGYGTLITDCDLLTGNIAPTVIIYCSRAWQAFDAFAVSATAIQVLLPTHTVKLGLRRAAKGTGDWVTVAAGAEPGSVILDRSVVPNRVYEYQWAPAGTEEWSESNEAWTTVSYERIRILSGWLGTDSAGYRIVQAPAAEEYRVVQADPRTESDADEYKIIKAAPAAQVHDVTQAPPRLEWIKTQEERMTIRRDQTPTFVARISRPDGSIIAPTEIESISYTVFKTVYDAVGVMRRPVAGHTDIDVPLTALLEFPVADIFWDGIQTGEGLIDPSETVRGIRFVVTESETAGEFDVSVYLNGQRIGSETTDDGGIGANLGAVSSLGVHVQFNGERTIALYPGVYEMTGGDEETAASANCNGELLATAGAPGDWANSVVVTDSARVRGYNFKHSPNTRELSAFAESGTFEIQYRLLPFTGNPIVIAWTVEVL